MQSLKTEKVYSKLKSEILVDIQIFIFSCVVKPVAVLGTVLVSAIVEVVVSKASQIYLTRKNPLRSLVCQCSQILEIDTGEVMKH